MFETLKSIDSDILLLINSLHSSFLDQIMFAVSGLLVFIPLFLYVFYLFYKKNGAKYLAIMLVFLGLIIALCDQTSNITKHAVKRYRPTYNLTLKEKIHIINNYSGGKYGFFSGHASNSFGTAMFLFLLLNKQTRAFRLVFFMWAGLTSYSRMYLGVHFPSDIFVGAIVGCLIGYFVYRLFNLFIQKKYNAVINL